MQELNLKPTHKLVKSYYDTLGHYGQLEIAEKARNCVTYLAIFVRGGTDEFDFCRTSEALPRTARCLCTLALTVTLVANSYESRSIAKRCSL